MTAPHDTPRTDERAGLSEVVERVRMYLAAEDDPADANTGAVAWCEVASQTVAYPLWLSDLRAITDAADRLAAAVARADAAEAKVAAVEGLADEWASGFTLWRKMAAHDLRAALADVPTSAPTGEA